MGSMPGCSCATDYDAIFDDRMARRELEAYRRRGPQGSTRRLIGMLLAEGVTDSRLIDIGGGVGVIGHELLAAGAASVLDVDASHGYLAAARAEAERRGLATRAEYRYGDFVELSGEIEPADLVTLDRVLCCYADWEALVARSTERARRIYAIVYPTDRWWMRAAARLGNAGLALFRQSFRFHVHPNRAVERRIRAAGFQLVHRHRGAIWQTLAYRRV